MVIGFILLSGEGILVHRRLAGRCRANGKLVHLSVQAAALGFGLIGVWAKFKGKDGIVSNFYSLHSWIGLSSVLLLASQCLIGFISMWHRTEGWRTRPAVLPWHVFFGLYAFGLAVTAAETGLQEKLTFLQARRGGPARKSREVTLINSIGIALAILPAFVILAAISPRHREGQITKFINSKDAENGKSHV
ncbi:putative transmembrane ascorbate ferrireductase 4 [Platanthera zijinensis]|uniref:Transmembrane ascorbate ferrireductase 4 n=1 Tax=Platanthera zijinensis TaxID=2320716 RepID=A0AAP0GBK6_9ASPA